MLPLDLYARVRISYYHAHETAGAARTRSSLRPLFGEVAKITANLGRDASRERGHISGVVPGLTGRPSIPEPVMIKSRSRGVLDPRVRGDDGSKKGITINVIARSACDEAIHSLFV